MRFKKGDLVWFRSKPAVPIYPEIETVAKPQRKLKAKWLREAEDDMAAFHGIETYQDEGLIGVVLRYGSQQFLGERKYRYCWVAFALPQPHKSWCREEHLHEVGT